MPVTCRFHPPVHRPVDTRPRDPRRRHGAGGARPGHRPVAGGADGDFGGVDIADARDRVIYLRIYLCGCFWFIFWFHNMPEGKNKLPKRPTKSTPFIKYIKNKFYCNTSLA